MLRKHCRMLYRSVVWLSWERRYWGLSCRVWLTSARKNSTFWWNWIRSDDILKQRVSSRIETVFLRDKQRSSNRPLSVQDSSQPRQRLTVNENPRLPAGVVVIDISTHKDRKASVTLKYRASLSGDLVGSLYKFLPHHLHSIFVVIAL